MPPGGGRPLTPAERARLLADCVPFLVLLVATIVVATIWSDLTEALAGRRTPFLFGVVLGVVLLFTGATAVRRVRDVLAGSAAIERDHLRRLSRPHRGSRRRGYGHFEHLGQLRLSAADVARAGTTLDVARLGRPGADPGPPVFRIAYSPASKIAWSIEPV